MGTGVFGGGKLFAVSGLFGVMLFSFLWFGSPPPAYALPAFPNTGGTVPSALAGIASQSGRAGLETLARASASVPNESQFTVSYAGKASLSFSHFPLSLISVNSPLGIAASRYANDFKVGMDLESLPVIGQGNLTYVNLTTGSLLCSNVNVTSLKVGNFWNLLFGPRAVTCRNFAAFSGGAPADYADSMISQVSNYGVALTFGSEYQSVYEGQPCTYISGNLNESSQGGAGVFGMCISDAYYVPLSLAVHFSNSAEVLTAGVNETTIGAYSQKQAVDSLPV
jgi:hypothetical protein